MNELIEHAMELIQDRPEESNIINWVLSNWDDEMRAAFKLAWKLLHEKGE